MSSKDLTSEDIVTCILTHREILRRQSEPVEKDIYATNPTYDLTRFLTRKKHEYSRFGPKYIFVK